MLQVNRGLKEGETLVVATDVPQTGGEEFKSVLRPRRLV
jgi:hypothetical protein